MSTGRNDPCPCGSGKKYKKCCGSIPPAEVEQARESAALRLSQAIAYKGELGRVREQFCRKYLEYKRRALIQVGRELQAKVAADHEVITCASGCSACCFLFVRATIQECEAIVFHLYQQPEALAGFLQRYKEWWEKIQRGGPAFKTIVALSNLMHRTQPYDMEIQYEAALRDYRLQNLACPFLVDNACSIYDIRPWVCAGVVSSTPREWCEPSSSQYHDVNFYTVDAYVTREKQLYLPAQVNLAMGCFPVMVYHLLVKGYGLLELIPGMAGLTSRVMADPEVAGVISGLAPGR
jgi:hypothetical protein